MRKMYTKQTFIHPYVLKREPHVSRTWSRTSFSFFQKFSARCAMTSRSKQMMRSSSSIRIFASTSSSATFPSIMPHCHADHVSIGRSRRSSSSLATIVTLFEYPFAFCNARRSISATQSGVTPMYTWCGPCAFRHVHTHGHTSLPSSQRRTSRRRSRTRGSRTYTSYSFSPSSFTFSLSLLRVDDIEFSSRVSV